MNTSTPSPASTLPCINVSQVASAKVGPTDGLHGQPGCLQKITAIADKGRWLPIFKALTLAAVTVAASGCGGNVGQLDGSVSGSVYTVSGSASGLTGTVVLQNNGGDNLVVSANSAFTFSQPIPSGSLYNVTIVSAPADQSCSIANGTGTIGATNVIDVALTCVTIPVPLNVFSDSFDVFDSSIWSCEYSCPTVSGGVATFALQPNIAPNNMGSWSKIRYKPRRFTSGDFSVTFKLSQRPSQAVWWGIALWDTGPNPDESQFNEINFGITTSESSDNFKMRFESAKLGNGVSIIVDTNVDLYDGTYHVGRLVYDATHVDLYFDGTLLKTITDVNVIPTDPMDFIIGPRLVTGSTVLTSEFDEIADYVRIAW